MLKHYPQFGEHINNPNQPLRNNSEGPRESRENSGAGLIISNQQRLAARAELEQYTSNVQQEEEEQVIEEELD